MVGAELADGLDAPGGVDGVKEARWGVPQAGVVDVVELAGDLGVGAGVAGADGSRYFWA